MPAGGDALPSEVDVVVLGTGLPESILAAACARSGLVVLHLDRNDYYGGPWSSFHLKSVTDWSDKVNAEKSTNSVASVDSNLVNEGEEVLLITPTPPIQQVEIQWHTIEENGDTSSGEKQSLRKFIEENWRKFSLDLLPKILLARGEMVKTLCDSEVSKYCEFKCVDRLLCCTDEDPLEGPVNNLQVVPCSRGEIFQSDVLSMVEKRRIMKFLTSCVNWQQNPDELNGWTEFADKPFDDFLESRGITGNLKRFVADTIGILKPNTNAEEGIYAVCRFMESVGRFGNSPFLYALYGSGELPQCFCRLCAVFGGTYCLNQPVEALIYRDKSVNAVITGGQRISCKYVLMNFSYIPVACAEKALTEDNQVLRAILISDRSLLVDTEKEHISLLNLMRLNPAISARLLEVGLEACTAPKGYFVSHLTACGNGNSKEVLSPLIDRLYRYPSTNSDGTNVEGDSRPLLLWSLFFNISRRKILKSSLPDNVRVVPEADVELDYSLVVSKVRKLFEELWPDRDFLPRSLSRGDEEEDRENGAENGNNEDGDMTRNVEAE